MPFAQQEEADEDKVDLELLYLQQHYRDDEGRYYVPTPWKDNAPELGHSYRKAVKFFLGQEKRWNDDKEHMKMSN